MNEIKSEKLLYGKKLKQKIGKLFQLNIDDNRKITHKQLLTYFSNEISVIMLNMINNICIKNKGYIHPSKDIVFNNIFLCTNKILRIASAIRNIIENTDIFDEYYSLQTENNNTNADVNLKQRTIETINNSIKKFSESIPYEIKKYYYIQSYLEELDSNKNL